MIKLKGVIIVLCALAGPTLQHGRLMEPPSRASMWRVGFPTPKDQNDNECYCGGYGVQHHQNRGKCGICGDPWHKIIKEHEAPGGVYANGIITKIYKQGSFIPVVVDLTANHQGYFEFKICPNDDIFQDPDQSCFDLHGPLWVGGGDPEHDHRRHPIYDYETGLRLVYVRLPLNMTCDQCIIQWTYVAGNNWGICEDGTSGNGCGPQETFRGCSDIAITPNPILSSLIGSDYQSSNDDIDEDDVYDGSVYETSDSDVETSQTSHSLEEKEASLRKKKILLQKVLRQLRTLIDEAEKNAYEEVNVSKKDKTVSKFNDDTSDNSDEVFSQILTLEKHKKLKKIHEEELKSEPRANVDTIPWWDRIFSNRH